MSAASAAASPARDAPVARRAWTAALLVLGASLAVLGFAFAEEAAAAVGTWERSTAYNHCWLVLPIAAWLAWTRRDRLAGLYPEPTFLPAIPALGAAVAWLAAERLGIMEGRQLAALALVVLGVVAVLGLRIGRAMAAPLAYLVFLVPFGAFAVPLLQRVTAWMIVAGLRLLEIPHHADDLVIEIPAGTFYVAEACAGLRFIVASLAFGALYAFVMFRGAGRRLVVLGLAVAVPVVANGLRALGIVVLGHHLGSAEAAAADHVIYGWAFFSLVILLLIAAGLPFRQDGPAPGAAALHGSPPSPAAGPSRPWQLAVAGGLCVALAVAGPAIVARLSGNGQGATPLASPLVAPGGCAAVADGLRCADALVSAGLLRFPSHLTWSSIVAEGQRLAGADDEASTFSVVSDGAVWRVRQSAGDGRTVAVATWLGGRPAGGGMRDRAEQAWSSLRGGGTPVLAVVTVRDDATPRGETAGQRDRALLRRVLAAQDGDWARRVAGLSRAP